MNRLTKAEIIANARDAQILAHRRKLKAAQMKRYRARERAARVIAKAAIMKEISK